MLFDALNSIENKKTYVGEPFLIGPERTLVHCFTKICHTFAYVFYVWDKNLDFLRKTDQFWANTLYVQEGFFAKSLQKTCS